MSVTRILRGCTSSKTADGEPATVSQCISTRCPFGAMATVASGTTEALLFANLVASAAVALSDVVVDSLVVEKARDEAEAASLQSVAWGSRYVGAIGAARLARWARSARSG